MAATVIACQCGAAVIREEDAGVVFKQVGDEHSAHTAVLCMKNQLTAEELEQARQYHETWKARLRE